MNEQTNTAKWNEKTTRLRAKHSNLNHIAADLPEAAKMEITSKLDQCGVMLSALERDVREVESDEGADHATVSELYAKTSQTINDLHYELEALASGNPTTVSAAVDATSRLVEKSGEAIKTITSKIPILSQDK